MNPNYLKNKQLALQNQAVAPMAASNGMSELEKPEGLNRDITAKNFGRDARTVVDSLVGGPLSVVKDALMIAPTLRRAATDFVGDSASDIYDGFTGTDSNNPEAAVSPVEDDPLDTGTGQKDEYDILTGSAKAGDGSDITPTKKKKEEAKSIFDKASNLFGDIFSAPDLKRMTLYTLGGLMTGGSLGGSFKWAGLQVMNEQQATAKNNATLGAAANKAALKEPVPLKVEGYNEPIMGRWNGASYVALNGAPLPLKTVPWGDTYSAKSMKDIHVGVIEGLESGTSDTEGNPVIVGERADVIYNKYRVFVKELSEEQGYNIDLSSALSAEVLRIATKQAIDANKGKVDGFVTPESFFDGALIRGVVTGQAGSQDIFKDSDGASINVKANDDMVAKIETIRLHGKKTGKNSSTATVMADVYAAWMGKSKSKSGKGLTKDQRDDHNSRAGEGQSGFIHYLMSIK